MYFGLIHTHFPLYPVPTLADLSSLSFLYFQVFFVWLSEFNWDCLWNKGKGLFTGDPEHVAPPLKKKPHQNCLQILMGVGFVSPFPSGFPGLWWAQSLAVMCRSAQLLIIQGCNDNVILRGQQSAPLPYIFHSFLCSYFPLFCDVLEHWREWQNYSQHFDQLWGSLLSIIH